MNSFLTVRSVTICSLVALVSIFILSGFGQTMGEYSIFANTLWLWPPVLILACGCVWLNLSRSVSEGKEGRVFQISAWLMMITIFWAASALMFKEDLRTDTSIDQFRNLAYVVWIGTSLLAIDATVAIWGVFHALSLRGKNPVPYLITIAVIFFMATPLVHTVMPTLPFMGIFYEIYYWHLPFFGMVLPGAMIGGLIWGMVYDRNMVKNIAGAPSPIQLIAASAFSFGVIPVAIAILNILTMGFSGTSTLTV